MSTINRIAILILFIASLSFLFLSNPEGISAQACIGDSGGVGECLSAMACPPSRIDGQGDCVGDPLTGPICCLDEIQCGTVTCGGSCSDTSECLCGYSCQGGFCTHPTACQACTGDSGYSGTCLFPGVCAGLGRNNNDGNSGCSAGSVCCTEAPSGNTCALIAQAPFLVGAWFAVTLGSSTPNAFYTMSAPGCTGSCFNIQTDDKGLANCTLSCGPPAATYTITAKYSDVTCSTTVDVLNEPGPPCIGTTTGEAGHCVVLMCPKNTEPDGFYPNVCSVDGAACCIPYSVGGRQSPNTQPVFCNKSTNPNVGSIDTAIGCISVKNNQKFIEDILGYLMGIAGGLGFVLIVYSGFLIMTSSGDPKKLSAGKELLSAAIAGLLLLILGTYLLRVIGVDILGIF